MTVVSPCGWRNNPWCRESPTTWPDLITADELKNWRLTVGHALYEWLYPVWCVCKSFCYQIFVNSVWQFLDKVHTHVQWGWKVIYLIFWMFPLSSLSGYSSRHQVWVWKEHPPGDRSDSWLCYHAKVEQMFDSRARKILCWPMLFITVMTWSSADNWPICSHCCFHYIWGMGFRL